MPVILELQDHARPELNLTLSVGSHIPSPDNPAHSCIDSLHLVLFFSNQKYFLMRKEVWNEKNTDSCFSCMHYSNRHGWN